MDNLDLMYDAAHPPVSAEDRRFTWQGVILTRRQAVPLAAFQIIEDRPESFLSLVAAARMMLEQTDAETFDHVIAANPEIDSDRISALVRYLMEKSMLRPTPPAGSSSPSASANGTPSTPGVSTDEAWTSASSVPGASPTSPTPS